mgnify:CR=1 FL=1
MKLHEQWFVGVKHRYNVEKGLDAFRNAIQYMPNRKSGVNYCKTEEEAKKVLANALEKFNGKKQYDKDGKWRERMDRWIEIVSDKKSDEDLMIVSWVIRKRMVTDWEDIDEK